MTTVNVFVTLGLYHAIRLSTTLFMPFAITFMMEMKVTLDRTQVSTCVIFSVSCYVLLLNKCRTQSSGRLGRKSFPNLVYFSLFRHEGEVTMYITCREIQNFDQNFCLNAP